MSISVPVFRSLVGGKTTEQAAKELAARVSYARGYAVSHHTYVAIVFPRIKKNRLLEGCKVETGLSAQEYFNHSYRMAEVRREGGAYQFISWLPDSQWNFFPRDIIIPPSSNTFAAIGWQKDNDRDKLYKMTDPDPDQPPDYLKVDTGAAMPTVKNVDWTDFDSARKSNSKKGIDMDRCMIFKPDGQLVSGDKKHFLVYFTEAAYDPDTVETNDFIFIPKNKMYKNNDKTGDLRTNYTIVDVNPLSGKVRYHHLNAKFNGYDHN